MPGIIEAVKTLLATTAGTDSSAKLLEESKFQAKLNELSYFHDDLNDQTAQYLLRELSGISADKESKFYEIVEKINDVNHVFSIDNIAIVEDLLECCKDDAARSKIRKNLLLLSESAQSVVRAKSTISKYNIVRVMALEIAEYSAMGLQVERETFFQETGSENHGIVKDRYIENMTHLIDNYRYMRRNLDLEASFEFIFHPKNHHTAISGFFARDVIDPTAWREYLHQERLDVVGLADRAVDLAILGHMPIEDLELLNFPSYDVFGSIELVYYDSDAGNKNALADKALINAIAMLQGSVPVLLNGAKASHCEAETLGDIYGDMRRDERLGFWSQGLYDIAPQIRTKSDFQELSNKLLSLDEEIQQLSQNIDINLDADLWAEYLVEIQLVKEMVALRAKEVDLGSEKAAMLVDEASWELKIDTQDAEVLQANTMHQDAVVDRASEGARELQIGIR